MFKGFSKGSGNPPDPPPYCEKDKSEGKATADAQQERENRVQLCPHERLSFESFRLIQKKLHKGEEKRLDALSAMPTHHAGMQKVESFENSFSTPPQWDVYQICKPDEHTSGPALVQGQAACMGIIGGLEFLSIWKIALNNRKLNQEAFTQIQNLFKPFQVRLCPHRNLHDEAVVTKFVSMVAPQYRDPDSLQRFRKNEQLRRCRSCQSMFEFEREEYGMKHCIVTVTREIKGESPDDALWSRQCTKIGDGEVKSDIPLR